MTGKKCPAYWCDTPEKDLKWKTEFWNKLEEKDTEYEVAKNIVKKSANLSDETIDYLAKYKYSKSLFVKLSNAMK